MSPEPKKPIEELLGASARARRAEFAGDQKMPNPMRAQLHEEIARLNRGDLTRRRRNWLAAFWPQISLATAVAAVLVTASVLWFRNQTKPETPAMQIAMAPVVPPNESSDTLRSLDAAQIDRIAKDEAKTASVSAAVEPKSSIVGGAVLADKAAEKILSQAAQMPAAAAPVVAARSFVQSKQAAIANLSQRFAQTAAKKKTVAREEGRMKEAAPANVLNTFDVQQEGNRIRVVDEDGSTYTGTLEPISQNDTRSLSQKIQQTTASANSPNEYLLRASGISNSLKKKVVLEANYVANPPDEQRGRRDQSQQQAEEQAPARIVGTAKINGEPPVEVDAVSVTR